jgi:hypothetical protein
MEEQKKNIKKLISAFESRNILLHDEIKANEEAIEQMRKELEELRINEELKECNVDGVA